MSSVLIVERDQEAACSLKQVLEGLGSFVLNIFENIQEVLDKLQYYKADVVFMGTSFCGVDPVDSALFIYRQYSVPIIYIITDINALDERLNEISNIFPACYVTVPFVPSCVKAALSFTIFSYGNSRKADSSDALNNDVKSEQAVLFREIEDKNKELMIYKTRLQGIIEEKTTELQDALWREKRSNQAKTEFLMHVSHELRTPLHCVLSFAKLGLDKASSMDKEKAEDYFSSIIEGSQKLTALISELMDFSRFESNNISYIFEKHDVKIIAEEILEELSVIYADKNVTFELICSGNCEDVVLDRLKMLQVLRNILVNAIKFSPDESKITIRLQGQAQYVRISIADQGAGIASDELEAIFEKYVRGSGTRDRYDGTGLGLAIAKRIVMDHGGRIWAESSPGNGAVFFVELTKDQARKAPVAPKRLGELLLEEGMLRRDQLDKALRKQREYYL